MKKLLSMIGAITLGVTGASSLKPLFASNVSQGFKSNPTNTNISIQGENDTNPFYPKQLPIFNKQGIGAIAIDSRGNTYVGADDGTNGDGLYKSTDGINFNKIMDTPKAYIDDIVIQDEIIYVSTNVDGLWKSTDGIHFNKINAINYINSLAVDSSGNIYAGTKSDGLWKSTDGGKKFSQVGNINKFINKIVFVTNGVIFVAVDGSGLYKSTDGINFNKIMTTQKKYIGAIAIDSSGNIYAGFSYDGLYKSTDGINFNKINAINCGNITGILITKNQNFYVSTNGDGLWKSTDGGNTFTEIKNSPKNIRFNSLVITPNDVIYIGTFIGSGGVWTINLINQLLKIDKPDTFDNSWPKYKGIVYNSAQKIDIKENLVTSTTLDRRSITIPTTDLDIPVGEHNLVLTLKDEYKKYSYLFGGDNNTGEITYKLWVKTSIDKKSIKYSTNGDDTDLTNLSLGFVSTSGNTNNCPIIQTKTKDGSGVHNAPLTTKFTDSLINYQNSYYVQGTVDNHNNFTENGTKQELKVNTKITTDGTYHLHLVDTVGNTYNSYLELGKDNWKLQGTFKNDKLDDLKTKLNVTVNLTDHEQLAQATGWLTNYEKFATDLFEKSVKANSKEFDSEIKTDLVSDFKWFLNPLTYDHNNEPKFADGIDKGKLNSEVAKIAEQKLQEGLSKVKTFTENLNVDDKNVEKKSTLDSYSTWITNYDNFINNHKDRWISDIVKVAACGFATTEQEKQIHEQVSKMLDNDNIKHYLLKVEWTPTSGLTTSDDYKQFVELDKLQSDTINWVNQNIPEINQAYQQALKTAESGLNLHGYSIETLLNGKPLPNEKEKFDNFADGQSFHNWLQSQANIKFHGWQLTMGLGIGIPLFLISLGIAWFVRKATDPRYNPFARGRKEQKVDDNIQKKNLKEIKTKKNDE